MFSGLISGLISGILLGTISGNISGTFGGGKCRVQISAHLKCKSWMPKYLREFLKRLSVTGDQARLGAACVKGLRALSGGASKVQVKKHRGVMHGRNSIFVNAYY